MQDIHDARQKEYKVHFKKIAKYEQKNKDLLTRTPMYVELEKKYKEQFELPEIEDRLKVLEAIREFRKPIDHDKLLRHSISYSEMRRKKILELEQEKRTKIEQDAKHYNMSQFKSRFTDLIMEEDHRKMEEQDKFKQYKDTLLRKR